MCVAFTQSELRLRVFKGRVLRKVFACKIVEVTRIRKKLHSQKLHNVYSLPDIITVIRAWMRCTGHVEHMGERRNGHKILVRTSEGKRPLLRPRQLEDNVMDLK